MHFQLGPAARGLGRESHSVFQTQEMDLMVRNKDGAWKREGKEQREGSKTDGGLAPRDKNENSTPMISLFVDYNKRKLQRPCLC